MQSREAVMSCIQVDEQSLPVVVLSLMLTLRAAKSVPAKLTTCKPACASWLQYSRCPSALIHQDGLHCVETACVTSGLQLVRKIFGTTMCDASCHGESVHDMNATRWAALGCSGGLYKLFKTCM